MRARSNQFKFLHKLHHMSIAKRIAKNTGVLVIGDTLKSLLYFILVIYMARILGAAEFGKYSFAVNFTLLAGIIPDMGLNYLYIRDVSRDRSKAKKYMSNFISIKILLSTITFTLIVLAINLLGYPQDTTFAVYGMAVYMILTSFFELFRSSFYAFEKMEYDAAVKITERVLLFSAGMYVLLAGYGLMGIISISMLAAAVAFIMSFIFMLWRFVRPVLSLDFEFCRKSIKTAFPFGVAVIFSLIYFGIDSVMLMIMAGDRPVGIYNAAYNLILGITIIPTAFTAAIYPLLSRYFKTSRNSLRALHGKAMKYLVMLAIPIGFIITLTAPKIIDFLYGPEYASSALALQLLVWGGAAWFISMGVNASLRAVDRQKTLAWIAGTGAALNVSLNIFLIPMFGYIGAGIATIITQFFVLFAGLKKLSSTLPLPSMWGTIAKSVISSMAVLLILQYLMGLHVLLLALAALVYFPIIFILRGFDRDDFGLLKQIFSSGQK